MYINSTIGAHTLSLFGVNAQGGGATKAVQNMIQTLASPAKTSAPASATVSTRASTSVDVQQSKQVKKYNKYADAAYHAKMNEIGRAKDAAKAAFRKENGYYDRTGVGRQIGASRAGQVTAGEMSFQNRETTLVTVKGRVKNLLATVDRINRNTTMTAVPSVDDHTFRDYRWDFMEKDEAATYLAGLSPEMQDLAERRRVHDIEAEGYDLDIKRAEALRDFGIPRSVTSGTVEGGINVHDFDVTHSKFGKIATVRNGELFLIDGEGAEILASDYEFDETLFHRT